MQRLRGEWPFAEARQCWGQRQLASPDGDELFTSPALASPNTLPVPKVSIKPLSYAVSEVSDKLPGWHPPPPICSACLSSSLHVQTSHLSSPKQPTVSGRCSRYQSHRTPVARREVCTTVYMFRILEPANVARADALIYFHAQQLSLQTLPQG